MLAVADRLVGGEFGMLLRISGGAMSTLVTPLILLALVAFDVLVIQTAWPRRDRAADPRAQRVSAHASEY